jgi:type VI secretion system secreted protein Hcp
MSRRNSSRACLSVEPLEDRLLAAVDAFIWFKEAQLGRPVGETAKASNPAFEIKDFSFGVENPTSIRPATGGAGAGKVKFNEFTIKKTADSASPAFFKNCCAGAHYGSVIIEMRKAGGDPQSAGKPYLQFKFGTVFTTKIDWSGPGDEGSEESITFVYAKLDLDYQGGKVNDGAVDSFFDIEYRVDLGGNRGHVDSFFDITY